MKNHPLSSLDTNTRIAGEKTVSDWIALRSFLIGHPCKKEKWNEAYDFLRLRIDARFITPIKNIIAPNTKLGEGYSVSALQCILLEFLEALFQGKVYRTPIDDKTLESMASQLGTTKDIMIKHTQPDEYTSSRQLFLSFLTKRKPFSEHFTTKSYASIFYNDIRCGLLHEAATKGESLILAEKERDPNCLVEKIGRGIVIYRNPFTRALIQCTEDYQDLLLNNTDLQAAFLRKMDDISQIKRCFYFAYGSNMDKAQIGNRVKYLHSINTACLNSYIFKYNKISKDGTSKANIEKYPEGVVWGACYELDAHDFSLLHENHEQRYSVKDIWVETTEGIKIIAKTFISKDITDAMPAEKYVNTVLQGASDHKLPHEYIEKYLKVE